MEVFIILFCVFAAMIVPGVLLVTAPLRSFAAVILVLLAGSLWIVCVAGYVRFLSGIGAWTLLAALAALIALRLAWRPGHAARGARGDWAFSLGALGLHGLLMAAGAYAGYTLDRPIGFLPFPTFVNWDGVLSYNRWAIEMLRFEYTPYNAFYPTAFPAIWSMVYDLQGDARHWVFPKLLIGAIAFVLLVAACHLPRAAGWRATALFAVGIGVLCIGPFRAFASGQMDYPAATLLFLGLFLLGWSLRGSGPPDRALLIGAFCALGLAAATKQSGFAAVIPGAAALIVARRHLTGAFGAFLGLLLVVPVGLSGLLFARSGEAPFGNLGDLAQLADARREGPLSSLMAVAELTHPAFLALVVAAALYAATRPGRNATLSVVYLVVAVAGGAVYHECCSYSPRHGVWLYAFLLAALTPLVFGGEGTAARSGSDPAPGTLRGAARTGTLLAAVFALAGTAVDRIMPYERIDAYFRILNIPPDMQTLLRREAARTREAGVVLSLVQTLGFVDLLDGRHVTLTPRRDGTKAEFYGPEGRSPLCPPTPFCTAEDLARLHPGALFLLEDVPETLLRHPLQQVIRETFDLEEVASFGPYRLYAHRPPPSMSDTDR